MTFEELSKKYPDREAAFPSHLDNPNKPLSISTSTQKKGLVIYAGGTVLYFAS